MTVETGSPASVLGAHEAEPNNSVESVAARSTYIVDEAGVPHCSDPRPHRHSSLEAPLICDLSAHGTGAIVPAEVACQCVTVCDREGEAPGPVPCRYCRLCIDPVYDPCPRLGFGCGPGCDCCTPEQQAAAHVI